VTAQAVPLPGIEGHNPLGALAALGALSLATDGAEDGQIRLSWQRGGRSWHPVLFGDGLTRERALEAIARGHEARDLKNELGWDRDIMRLTRDDTRQLLHERLTQRKQREAEIVGASVSELPLRPPGREFVSYTPFRLMPRRGRARFLDKVKEHSEQQRGTPLVEGALFGTWQYIHANSLGWDPAAGVAARAYTAEAPTFTGPRGVPGALLLAARGWTFFPLTQSRRRAMAPGMADGRRFVWPLWSEPLDEGAVRLLLRLPALYRDGDEDGQGLLARHGVTVRMVAERVPIGDDGAVFTWGEPR
jgi:hypothetical protein